MAKRQKKSVQKQPTRPVKSAPVVRDDNMRGASTLLGKVKHPLDTIEACEQYLQWLHIEIVGRHGTAVAYRIFDRWGTPSSGSQDRFEKAMLWSWWEIMKRGGATLEEAAERLDRQNKKSPREDRYGGPSAGAIAKRIQRLPQYVPIRKRRPKAKDNGR
jgi:hypothetical protein